MSEVRHLVIGGQKVSEVNYKMVDKNGVERDACTRTFGHLNTVEMMLHIQRQRKGPTGREPADP